MRRLLAIAVLAIAVAASVQASFAAAPGFSGRTADCTSCHQPPLHDDTAQVSIEGIPDAWVPEQTYGWTVRVEGGPATIPGGPQAGFEVEVLDGTMHPDGPGTRTFHSKQATYTEDGVFQREWTVRWTAPDLSSYPTPVSVWVAGIAANGNHNTELNRSDAGEHGDSTHTAHYVVPPDNATLDAWRALPLTPPTIDRVEDEGTRFVIHGRMADANASAIEVHDGNDWIRRDVGPAWKLNVQASGDVQLRAAGSERVSPAITIDLATGTVNAEPATEQSPAPLLLIPLLIATLWRRP